MDPPSALSVVVSELVSASAAFKTPSPLATALKAFPHAADGQFLGLSRRPPAPALPVGAGVHLNNISPRAWAAVRQHPYGFTADSVCASARALGSLWLLCTRLGEEGSPDGGGSPPESVRVDVVQDVVSLDLSQQEEAGGAPAGHFVAVKRTLGPCRVLAVLPHGVLVRSADDAPAVDCPGGRLSSAGDEGDANALAVARVLGVTTRCGGGTVEDALHRVHALTPARQGEADARLTALLAWLKKAARGWRKASGKDAGRFTLHLRDGAVSLTAEGGEEGEGGAGEGVGVAPPPPPPRPWLIDPSSVQALLMPAAGGGAQAAPGPAAGVKRPRPHDDGEQSGSLPRPAPAHAPPSSSASSSSSGLRDAPSGVHLAVIVPFRDQPEQNRGEQLRRFISHMSAFLSSPAVAPPLSSFHVLVVEQSHDGYKFNRGKLLNIGFHLACGAEGRGRAGLPPTPFNAFSFHDVDLLPGPPLGPYYALLPSPKPMHVGAAWSRYPYETYVGGILAMDAPAVNATNGFPNDFWGWGGEDDELYARLREARLLPVDKPPPSVACVPGVLVDLEESLIREVGGERAGTGLKAGGRTEWRNMWKREGLARHDATWRANGVSSLVHGRTYGVVGLPSHPTPHVTVVTVDLRPQDDPHAQKQEHTEPIEEAGRRR